MPVPQHPSQNVVALIDTNNLYHTSNTKYNANVDYKAFLDTAVGDRQLRRAIAYVIQANNDTENQFFDALNRIGIETKSKPIAHHGGGSRDGNWDLGIAVDALQFVYNKDIDVLVLGTGDGDFKPLVTAVQGYGVRVEVIAFGRSLANELEHAADHVVDMGDKPDHYTL